MSEEKNPTTASATEHDPVIAGTPEAVVGFFSSLMVIAPFSRWARG